MKGIKSDPDSYFLTNDYFTNPYPFFLAAHDEGIKIFWSKKINAWIVLSYDEVESGLASPDFNSAQRIEKAVQHFSAQEQASSHLAIDVLENWIVFQDPPNHTRLRKLVNKSFTPRTIAALRPQIEKLVDDLLVEAFVSPRESVNFVDRVSFMIPSMVICALLGIPSERQNDLRRWSDAIAGLSAAAQASEADIRSANEAVVEAEHYLLGLFDQIRSNPNETLLSKLLTPEGTGDQLSDLELVAMTVQLFFAGFETTEGLMGNLLIALLTHPQSLKELMGEPELLSGAIEECLRFDSSIIKQSRVASRDVQIGPELIRAGDYVHFMIAAANWDPRKFERPEVFDVKRTENDHLTFGHGIHFCIGAPMARLETEILFSRLLPRLSKIAINENQIQYPDLLAIRKPKALHISARQY